MELPPGGQFVGEMAAVHGQGNKDHSLRTLAVGRCIAAAVAKPPVFKKPSARQMIVDHLESSFSIQCWDFSEHLENAARLVEAQVGAVGPSKHPRDPPPETGPAIEAAEEEPNALIAFCEANMQRDATPPRRDKRTLPTPSRTGSIAGIGPPVDPTMDDLRNELAAVYGKLQV